MNVNKGEIVKYIASGLTRADIASIVGVTNSAITQLIDEHPELVEEAKSMKGAEMARQLDLNESYDDLEEQTLQQLKLELPGASYTEKIRLLHTLTTIKGSRAKNELVRGAVQTAGVQVGISDGKGNETLIQVRTQPQEGIVYNGNNELVAVQDETLAAMDSTSLEQEFDKVLGIEKEEEEVKVEEEEIDRRQPVQVAESDERDEILARVRRNFIDGAGEDIPYRHADEGKSVNNVFRGHTRGSRLTPYSR